LLFNKFDLIWNWEEIQFFQRQWL